MNRLVVTRIDTQNRPQPSVFQLEFPQPIVLVDRTRNLVSAGRKTWSLINRPNASSSGTRTFPRAPAPSIMPGEITPSVPWAMILIAAAIFSLVVGSVVVLRRRKRRLQGA